MCAVWLHTWCPEFQAVCWQDLPAAIDAILARAYVCIMAGMVLPIHKTHQKEQGRLFVARLVLWSKASTVPLDGWRLRSTLRTSDEVLSPETGRPHAPTKKIVSPEFADANLWQQRQEWCAQPAQPSARALASRLRWFSGVVGPPLHRQSAG